MDKKTICEAMYALPGNIVVKRRKFPFTAMVLLVAGAAMIALNSLVGESLSNDVRSALVFAGGALAIAGAVAFAARMFASDGTPYHSGMRSYLRYDELYFDLAKRGDVVGSVGDGAVERLLGMKHAHVPALTVAMYRTPDNRFAAMQAFEYADLEYRPVTELKIVRE